MNPREDSEGASTTETDFQKAVRAYLGEDGGTKARQRKMANELEVMPASIQRWALGVAKPLRGMEQIVLDWIAKQKDE